MGAWGPGPTENDQAGDWLSEFVWCYLLDLIESPLDQYREAAEQSSGQDRENHATAAAALLVDCTSKKTQTPYRIFTIRYKAKTAGLFDLAIDVVNKILEDDVSLRRWKNPAERVKALQGLKAELGQANEDEKK